jgi:hypothetical protein
MLSPRLTNCVECSTIPVLLNNIDCKLAEMAKNLYNNVVFMLNRPVEGNTIIDLLNYRRILTFKYCNPDYAGCYTVPMIASKVKILTAGCKTQPCLPCIDSTTTTTSSSSTTTTTTTVPYFYYVANLYECPNCDNVIGTNVVIKSLNVLGIGDWVSSIGGNATSRFNVLSMSGPNYMATLVDGSEVSPTCNCPA